MESVLVQVGVVAAVFIAIAGLLALIVLLLTNPDADIVTKRDKETSKASLLAVIGSGGHTTELLTVIGKLGSQYQPRYYVMANTDMMSEEKVNKVEQDSGYQYKILKIPRSREVKQSWITTVISTLYASLYSFPLVLRTKPEIVLCNGPGTCIPVCFAAFILKLFYPVKVIYIESICRVESLSLSGRILYNLADVLIVQWPQLQKKFPKTVYMGRIV